MANKGNKKEEWIGGEEAAQIMSKKNGHTIIAAYVRLLARKDKIHSRMKDGRTREYLKSDVSKYIVRQNKTSTRRSEVKT